MTKLPFFETKNRYAVCVGINQYAASAQISNDLYYAERDAQTLYELLLRQGFIKDNCLLLLGPTATLKAIYEALESFVLTKPGSDLTFRLEGAVRTWLPGSGERHARRYQGQLKPVCEAFWARIWFF